MGQEQGKRDMGTGNVAALMLSLAVPAVVA